MRRFAKGTEHIDILGVAVSTIDIPMAVAVIDGWISRREPYYVCAKGRLEFSANTDLLGSIPRQILITFWPVPGVIRFVMFIGNREGSSGKSRFKAKACPKVDWSLSNGEFNENPACLS